MGVIISYIDLFIIVFFCKEFRIFFSDNTELESLKKNPEFNIRVYDKNSESDYFFFLHQNQNIFFSNIGNHITLTLSWWGYNCNVYYIAESKVTLWSIISVVKTTYSSQVNNGCDHQLYWLIHNSFKKIDFDSLYLCTPKKSNSLKCKWNSISSMLQWVLYFQCLISGHKYKAKLLV
jgi:hypothetical protein